MSLYVKIVKELGAGTTMTREKKKLTYSQLEDHVIVWATEQLEQLREVDYTVEVFDQNKIIYHSMYDRILYIVELLKPLEHNEESLVEWAEDFLERFEHT